MVSHSLQLISGSEPANNMMHKMQRRMRTADLDNNRRVEICWGLPGSSRGL